MAVGHSQARIHPWPADPAALEQDLADAGSRLAGVREVPTDLEAFVRELARQVKQADDEDISTIDPYLVLAFERGLIEALDGLHEDDSDNRRTAVRIGLEQMRQALRDMLEEMPVSGSRPPKEVAAWLTSQLDVPKAQLSELIGVDPRTFGRWASGAESASPRMEEARRLRIVARVANHLRHALTSEGVIAWFYQPHPELKGRKPYTLLGKPDQAPLLLRLATSARTSGGT